MLVDYFLPTEESVGMLGHRITPDFGRDGDEFSSTKYRTFSDMQKWAEDLPG
jgi:hypothetical protein